MIQHAGKTILLQGRRVSIDMANKATGVYTMSTNLSDNRLYTLQCDPRQVSSEEASSIFLSMCNRYESGIRPNPDPSSYFPFREEL